MKEKEDNTFLKTR